jgi:hypothetical protein
MERVGGGERDDRGGKAGDRGEQALAVARADRDVAEAEAAEGVERDARDEGAGVVGRDDALARADARGGVGARRDLDPVRGPRR